MEEQAASAPATEATGHTAAPEAVTTQDVIMDVEPQEHRSGKRKAEDELVPAETKKAHVGRFASLSPWTIETDSYNRIESCSTQEVISIRYI